MRSTYLVSMIFLNTCLFGQTDKIQHFKGKLIDSVSLESIEFVNIGVVHTPVGTVSDVNGDFNLKIDISRYRDSTLTISAIGYSPIILKVNGFKSDSCHFFKLKPKIYQAPEVYIKGSKIKEKNYGIKSVGGGMVHGVVHGYEKAILVAVKSHKTLLKSVNFNLSGNSDSVIFRINFYTVSKTGPNKRIIEKNMIFRLSRPSDGWIKCDLQPEHLAFDSDYYIGIELLPQLVQGQERRPQFSARFVSQGKLYSRDYLDKWFEIKGIGVPINVSFYELDN